MRWLMCVEVHFCRTSWHALADWLVEKWVEPDNESEKEVSENKHTIKRVCASQDGLIFEEITWRNNIYTIAVTCTDLLPATVSLFHADPLLAKKRKKKLNYHNYRDGMRTTISALVWFDWRTVFQKENQAHCALITGTPVVPFSIGMESTFGGCSDNSSLKRLVCLPLIFSALQNLLNQFSALWDFSIRQEGIRMSFIKKCMLKNGGEKSLIS